MNTRATLAQRRYADPYLAGVALGLVLLAAFVLTGRGLGASGAFATTAATLARAVDRGAAESNPYLAAHLADGWLGDWLVLEILGVMVGGCVSAALAGRLAVAIERGPRIAPARRLVLAAAGGAIMGAGAALARGCTSGQALTGGALLSVGSWTFVAATFAAGYATMALARRAWT